MNTPAPSSYFLDLSSSDSDEYDSDDYESETKYKPRYETLEPPIKRRKLSLPPRTQVCIVSHFLARRYEAYEIVIADLDSLRKKNNNNDDDNEFIPIRPALRLKVSDEMEPRSLTFCGLGSKLYIFEPTLDLSGYAIDLSSYYRNSNDLTKPTVVIKRRMLRNNKIRDMLHPKKDPFAIPTPDAKKILLFSRDFYISDYPSPGLPEAANDFELYDPKTDTWQQLPGIVHDWSGCWRTRSGVISIIASTFIGESTFFIETSTKLMFAINLKSIDQGWQRMDSFYGSASPHPKSHDRFFVVEEHLCVNARVAYDIHKQVGNPFGFNFPPPRFDNSFQDFSAPLVTLLGEEEEEAGNYNFCTLLSGISTTTKNPHMILNITSCDLSRYKRNKDGSDEDYEELHRCMTVGDSIKFCLDSERRKRCFFPLCFFSIRH